LSSQDLRLLLTTLLLVLLLVLLLLLPSPRMLPRERRPLLTR
jgi:hypothetical protein